MRRKQVSILAVGVLSLQLAGLARRVEHTLGDGPINQAVLVDARAAPQLGAPPQIRRRALDEPDDDLDEATDGLLLVTQRFEDGIANHTFVFPGLVLSLDFEPGVPVGVGYHQAVLDGPAAAERLRSALN